MQTHSGPLVATRLGLRVIFCTFCGFAHLDPLPDAAALAAYYQSEFWQVTKNGWLAQYESQREWLNMRHADWLTAIEQHVKVGWLLDVGSGWGFFLNAAYRRGWHAIGIEPSQDAATYSRQSGDAVTPVGWEQFASDAKYHVISALWLMEHLPAPLDFLRFCRARLEPGGALLAAVPNEFNVLQSDANAAGKCQRDFWVHPTHINYWTPATFANLLGRAGFRIVDALATYPMEKFLLAGQDYTADGELGARCHAEARFWDSHQTREQRLTYYREMARRGLGRDMVIVAKVDA